MINMGIVDQLKKITNWESCVVVAIFIVCLTGIIIVGAYLSNDLLALGGLVAFGIPTSLVGQISTKAVTSTASNSTNNTSKVTLPEVVNSQARQSVDIADLKAELESIKMIYLEKLLEKEVKEDE